MAIRSTAIGLVRLQSGHHPLLVELVVLSLAYFLKILFSELHLATHRHWQDHLLYLYLIFM